ncbi:5-methylcytosine restriction system specificity protein McrC [Rhodococcus sp. NPDC004095]
MLFETDRLHVDDDPALEGLLRTCLRRAHTDPDSGGDALLQPAVDPLQPNDTNSVDGSATTDLLRLFERLDLLQPQIDTLTSGTARSPLHRPILYRRFLTEVGNRLSGARRGYRAVSRVHPVIRGRADPSSLGRYTLTGDPHILCHYSELTESTVLLGIVCAALDRIAGGETSMSVFSGELSQPRLRHDAVGLRRLLAEVESVPIHRALLEGPRLRLSRLDLAWASALAMSLAILSHVEVVASAADTHRTETFELSVRTDKLWERIVEEAMRPLGFDFVLPQTKIDRDMVEDPWIGAVEGVRSRTYPDLLAGSSDEFWIVDAKYKIRNEASAPSRDDQYQMFAYSHLVTDLRTAPRTVVLVYPGEGAPRRWDRGGTGSAILIACSISFPGPEDVRSKAAWDRYLWAAGEGLASGLATSGAGIPTAAFAMDR